MNVDFNYWFFWFFCILWLKWIFLKKRINWWSLWTSTIYEFMKSYIFFKLLYHLILNLISSLHFWSKVYFALLYVPLKVAQLMLMPAPERFHFTWVGNVTCWCCQEGVLWASHFCQRTPACLGLPVCSWRWSSAHSVIQLTCHGAASLALLPRSCLPQPGPHCGHMAPMLGTKGLAASAALCLHWKLDLPPGGLFCCTERILKETAWLKNLCQRSSVWGSLQALQLVWLILAWQVSS